MRDSALAALAPSTTIKRRTITHRVIFVSHVLVSIYVLSEACTPYINGIKYESLLCSTSRGPS